MELRDLHPQVALEVPGVAVFQLQHAVIQAAREFFFATRAWREPMESIAMVPGQSRYAIPLPPDTVLVEPTRVELDGGRLPSQGWWTTAAGELELSPGYRGHQLTGELALAPGDEADEIPDRIGNEFRDAITYGALSRLLRVPQAEWSDLRLAGVYAGLFNEAKDAAAVRAENGYKSNRTRRVRYGGL